jgi:hypothetical protein
MDQKQIQLDNWCQTIQDHDKSWSERYRAMQELVPYAHQPNVQEALGYGLMHDRNPEVDEVRSSQRRKEIEPHSSLKCNTWEVMGKSLEGCKPVEAFAWG